MRTPKAPKNPFTEKLSELGETDPVSVGEDAPYSKILDILRERRGGAVVLTRGGRVCGILTERDILNKHILEGLAPKTPASQLMTRDPATATPDATLRQAIALMHKKGVRNLPIVDKEGRLLGLLTAGRIIRYLAHHFPAEVMNLPPQPSQLPQEVEGA